MMRSWWFLRKTFQIHLNCFDSKKQLKPLHHSLSTLLIWKAENYLKPYLHPLERLDHWYQYIWYKKPRLIQPHLSNVCELRNQAVKVKVTSELYKDSILLLLEKQTIIPCSQKKKKKEKENGRIIPQKHPELPSHIIIQWSIQYI